MRKYGIFILILLLNAKYLRAQNCTVQGQTPASAILVCGSTSFGQASILACGSNIVPIACPNGGNYVCTEAYWYKLACYSSGTMGFVITPNNLNDNFDWQLFDKTARNPVDVFTDPSMFVACNWSSDPGETGASVDGISPMVCSGFGEPLFSQMPDLLAGHEYLLMVNNHDQSQGGFQVLINDGTAGISEGIPKLLNARSSCDGTKVFVLLNKPIHCNSLAANGTDFTINGGVTISSATALSCIPESGTDSVMLSLAGPLPSGNYILTIQNGTDGNTLLDFCGRDIPPNDQVSFVVSPFQPTPMDSITSPGCSPKTLQLVFRRPIQCNSIAANGTDFTITGPQPVTISSVTTDCNTGTNPVSTTSVINLQLSSILSVSGVYQIHLATGSDGNTIIDECGRMTTPGSSLSFTVKGTVSASFNYNTKTSCKIDTLSFLHDGLGGVTTWNWLFDNTITSNLQNPVKIFPAAGQHHVRLIVSNDACNDTSTITIKLDNAVKAGFEIPAVICPGDTLHFVNKSTGNIDTWLWSFGDGNSSNQQTPFGFRYPINGKETFYTVRLIAFNIPLNCRDTVLHSIKALGNCYIAVPSAFTPNGDGLNDWLYPLNALKADDLHFMVYNRLGQLVFETKDWTHRWDGKINGILQQTGIYAWILSYSEQDTGKKVFLKGTTLLMR